MHPIHYDAWSSDYKSPFGAVKINETLHFTIRAAVPDIVSIAFCLQEDGGKNSHYQEMTPLDSERYETELYLREAGLYFYYFKITQEGPHGQSVSYYGADQGGSGRCFDRLEEVKSYQLTVYQQDLKTPKWYREAVFYQIFPDRFWNGNPGEVVSGRKHNSFLYSTKEDDPIYLKNPAGEIIRWDFFGGNLKGIIEKIPYLQELGITGIYLNPIFEASSNHRYDTNDYFVIDPMLGDDEIFKELLERLHEAGIRLILDGVFSHVGKDSRYFNLSKLYGEHSGAAQAKNSPYYSWFKFDRYPDQYKAWWGVKDLPEVDKRNPDFQRFIYGHEHSVLEKWNSFGLDGWRLDVADELPDEFIEGIRSNLDRYPERLLIGEVWEDASNKIAYDQRRRYVSGSNLYGVMNYPLREAILDLLNRQKSHEAICRTLLTLKENYPREFYYNSFNNLGTHDTERILTLLQQDKNKLGLAFGLMFMMPGIPCIYYGDEAGSLGGKDPENRRFYPWGKEDQDLQASVREWTETRRHSTPLKEGDLQLFYTEEIFGICRYTETEQAFYFVNASDKLVTLDAEDLQSLQQNTAILRILKRHFSSQRFQPWEGVHFLLHSH